MRCFRTAYQVAPSIAFIATVFVLRIANADSYEPYRERRIADSRCERYIIVTRTGGAVHATPWGPINVAVVQRHGKSQPITDAYSDVEKVYANTKTGAIFISRRNSEVAVRERDRVVARFGLDSPPSTFIVTRNAILAIDTYGHNAFDGDPFGYALQIFALDGRALQRLRLTELYSPEEIDSFEASANRIFWFRGAWMDELDDEIVLVGWGNRIRVIDRKSGAVEKAGHRPVLDAIVRRRLESLRLALDLAIELRLEDALPHAKEILLRPECSREQRLRAAILMAEFHDEEGLDYVREIAALPHETGGNDAAFALYSLARVLDEKALPILQEQLGVDVYDAEVSEAMMRLAPHSITYLIEALSGETVDKRLRAASLLGKIGSDAEKAVPSLQDILENRNESETLRRVAQESIRAILSKE